MQGTWIFGYGSLIWRPSFPHAERRPARLRGYARRFWQGSTDHRGVPGAPGRVVTLVEQPGEACVGVAYRVSDEHRDEVLAGLDHREKGGYERRIIELELSSPDERVQGLVYLATAENAEYLGPAPLEHIARQVKRASGPSGPNHEYVIRLAESLRELGESDPHVFDLERLLLALPSAF